jgi:hypothetical protein
MSSEIMMDLHAHKASGNSSAINGAEAAELIATMSGELAQVARRHGFDALAYLLDMARLEAVNVKPKTNGRGGAN